MHLWILFTKFVLFILEIILHIFWKLSILGCFNKKRYVRISTWVHDCENLAFFKKISLEKKFHCENFSVRKYFILMRDSVWRKINVITVFPDNDAAALNSKNFSGLIKMQPIANIITFYLKPCLEKIKFIINKLD